MTLQRKGLIVNPSLVVSTLVIDTFIRRYSCESRVMPHFQYCYTTGTRRHTLKGTFEVCFLMPYIFLFLAPNRTQLYSAQVCTRTCMHELVSKYDAKNFIVLVSCRSFFNVCQSYYCADSPTCFKSDIYAYAYM